MSYVSWLIPALLVIVVLALLFLRVSMSSSTRARGYRRGEFSSDDIPDIDATALAKKYWKLVIPLILIILALSCLHTVPSGRRGVVITFGSVADKILDEGLNFKLPWQTVINMQVNLEIEEVTESTASKDLQEVTTQLAVHFNIMPDRANEVYQQMRQKYHSLLLRPVIQEDLKATTAQFTAEELITQRPLVVGQLLHKLRESLEAEYGIAIQTVNIIDFQFSDAFSDAIEKKVLAEQQALEAKNILEKVRWEQEQEIAKQEAQARIKIIQAAAQRNATITTELGRAEAVRIAADAEYYKIIMEQQGTAEGIQMVTATITEEYVRYLYMLQWDGELPDVLAGVEGTDILLLLEQDTGD